MTLRSDDFEPSASARSASPPRGLILARSGVQGTAQEMARVTNPRAGYNPALHGVELCIGAVSQERRNAERQGSVDLPHL